MRPVATRAMAAANDARPPNGRSLCLENPLPGLDRHLRNAIIPVHDNERAGVVVALPAGRGYG